MTPFGRHLWKILSLSLLLLPIGLASESDSGKTLDSISLTERMGRSMFPENWVDLIGRPCPVKFENYKVVLDSETLAPNRLTVDTTTITAQSREARMIAVLGANYRLVDSAAFHTPELGNKYISDLMQTYRNTMHYHHLRGFENIEGWFKTYEWVLANGVTVRAHLKANSRKGTYRGFLLYVSLPKSKAGDAKIRSIGKKMVISREDQIHAEWDVATNALTIITKQ